MSYSTFNRKRFDSMKEPMFFGENVNVARYDQQKHPIFEKLIEKQLSFFWRPEEVDYRPIEKIPTFRSTRTTYILK